METSERILRYRVVCVLTTSSQVLEKALPAPCHPPNQSPSELLRTPQHTLGPQAVVFKYLTRELRGGAATHLWPLPS